MTSPNCCHNIIVTAVWSGRGGLPQMMYKTTQVLWLQQVITAPRLKLISAPSPQCLTTIRILQERPPFLNILPSPIPLLRRLLCAQLYKYQLEPPECNLETASNRYHTNICSSSHFASPHLAILSRISSITLNLQQITNWKAEKHDAYQRLQAGSPFNYDQPPSKNITPQAQLVLLFNPLIPPLSRIVFNPTFHFKYGARSCFRRTSPSRPTGPSIPAIHQDA